ncbi:MAG: hypothetical protein M1812_007113 [Candelaria pacifica]|nr:MAG: hypothetical protein M1812_007113 [Candelaria pacifica]
MIFKGLTTFLLLLCFTLQTLAIADLHLARDEIGEGGVSYSVIAEFDFDVTDTTKLSDKQFNGFVRKAFAELVAASSRDKIERPALMTGLGVGKRIYLASSMKRVRGYFYKEDSSYGNAPAQLRDALTECSETGQLHRTVGGCGEVNAVALFYDTEDRDADLRNVKARIASWGTFQHDKDSLEKGSNKNACSEPGKWGCLEFCTFLGINIITEKADDESNFQFVTKQERIKCKM